MELKIDELSDSDTHYNNNTNYWENAPATQEKRKKKVSFDDILSNMNLVVNQQGVLQYMTPNVELEKDIGTEAVPLEKHSYIYNKYFKNYSDPQAAPPPRRVPKTMEEYQRMLMEDRIEAIRQKQRVALIKPKKLLFTSPEGYNLHIQATRNGLRRMGFQ